MKLRLIFLCIIAVLMQVTVAIAEDSVASDGKNKDAATIFNSIMRSLPGNQQATVDSTSKLMQTRNDTIVQNDKAIIIKMNEQALRESISELPEDIQVQIQKTLKDIEAQQATRMLEFKELNEKQK